MDEEKIIEAVRKRPTLYDKNDKRHHNREHIQMLWEDVSWETGEDVDEVKKKWTYLRDYYRKQKKHIFRTGRTANKHKKWPFFDSMAFMDPYMADMELSVSMAPANNTVVPKQEPSPQSPPLAMSSEMIEWASISPPSTQSGYQEHHQGTSRQQEPSPQKFKSSAKRKARESGYDGRLCFDARMREPFDYDYEEPERDDDPDGNVHFWNSLLPMLRRLEPLDSMKFKHEVQGLLIKYVEKLQSESSQTQRATPAQQTSHASENNGALSLCVTEKGASRETVKIVPNSEKCD